MNGFRMAAAGVALLAAACSTETFTHKQASEGFKVDYLQRFEIKLKASNSSLHPKYRFSRIVEVKGDTVVYVRSRYEPPPEGLAGAAGWSYYEFDAIKRGRSTIIFKKRFHQDDDTEPRTELEAEYSMKVRER